MARSFPQRTFKDLRRPDFVITVVAVHGAHVLLDRLPDHPSFGMPEHQPGRFLLKMKQVELLAEPAVVAPLGFLEHLQVRVLVFLSAPRRAVDALQLFVSLVAAPIRAGHLRQLENFQLARRRHVWTAA